MFESICLRHQNNFTPDRPIDLGLLAQSMLFYSNVLLIVKPHMLTQLVKEMGPELLIEYLKSGYLTLQYEEEGIGIRTNNTGSEQERHEGITFFYPPHALQDFCPKVFTEITGKIGRGRRLASQFMRFVSVVVRPSDFISQFNSDLLDQQLIKSIVQKFFDLYTSEYKIPDPLVFEIYEDSEKFGIKTNIDFVEANKIYHRSISSSHSSITPAYILSHILTTRENLHFTSKMNSDIALDSINSELLATKVNYIIDKSNKHTSQIDSFQNFVFDDGRALGEAINHKKHTFKDLLILLEEAKKFKDWVRGKPAEADLIKEYFREIIKTSWVDKLPSKSIRWVIFTGAGLAVDVAITGGVATVIGGLIGAADNLVLDKIIKGWKPSQFVEGPYKSFVKK